MDNSDDENSEDGLQIVIESPKPRKRAKKELDETDRQIIACVEKDIEENLEEKAAKANLSSKHVKNIIKHVVTNEHVLALVRHAENPDENEEPVTVYEPKYTRAKTKELLSSNTQTTVLPWASPPKTPSEVHVLFSEELQDDSSGDEYIPKTIKKSTPADTQADSSQTKSKNDSKQKKRKANIALRTRSKLSLSHTPLEEIEGAFMPPDITTDMYDMDCDDDVWKEFLKTFTRPLDEVTKAAEDEDHDPEYNILADEEIDEVDREELRADRAVTVSRKEFNCLMAELFEYADMYESNKLNDSVNTADECNSLSGENQAGNVNESESDSENDADISIRKCQIPILAQQLRQHVQILTQNFMLTYEHPEFSEMAMKFKELLLSLKCGSEGKQVSILYIMNLPPALRLIEDWENLIATKSKEVREMKQYVDKVIVESIEAKLAGKEYIVTFPPLLMKTIVNNETFMYPNLLPRIPFKSSRVTRSSSYFFTHSEENLIALFLEQAIPQLKQDQFHLTKWKKVNFEHVCHYIHKFLMPSVDPKKIMRYITRRKSPDSDENPIKFYFRNKKAPPTVHYVVPMDVLQMLPPSKRNPESLPCLWREFLYPDYEKEKAQIVNNNSYCNNNQIIIVSPPVKLIPTSEESVYNVNFAKKIIAERKILPNGPLPPLVTRSRKRRKLKETTKKPQTTTIISNKAITKINNTMLPDMPSLGGTPIKNQNSDNQEAVKNDETNVNNAKEQQDLSFRNITSFNFPHTFEGVCQFSSPFSTQKDSNSNTDPSSEKDNPDDINELMKASSTVKTVTKKEPSGAEKKRAKIRREFIANLAMATPNDPETELQKEESFADSFYEKIKQTLSAEDYDKLIDILGHYDENNGQFVDLYKNVQSVLLPKYKELSEEFLLFLTDIQAHKVGQLMPYFMMKDMGRFMKKLQKYFKEQPSHMRKIMKSLTELAENPDLTMETIKTTMLPLFKGNAALTDWFLQLFPTERPPNLLSSRPHEVIDIAKELSRQSDEEICETVILPDTDDPYGGSNCICTCHNMENPQFNSRIQHCVKCGLKFIQGKIYIQTGKGLRPAVVSFLTNSEKDHTKRLAAATQRKRSETSPSKQVTSPSKENQIHEEMRNSNESEDEADGSKKKNRRKRKPKQEKPAGKSNKETAQKVDKTNATSNPKPPKVAVKKPPRKRTNSSGKKVPEHKPGSTAGQQKRLAEDHSEVENSAPVESAEPKVSSDHSAESASEFFESSQDVTYTESDESSASSHSSPLQKINGSKRATWTREEDKIILQTFKQRNDSEETFIHISGMLQNRSVLEIKNRFHKLMTLLQQMASNSTS